MSEVIDRRDFMRSGAVGSIGAALSAGYLTSSVQAGERKGGKIIWADLLHLGYNMWCDWDFPDRKDNYTNASPVLRFDSGLWDELLPEIAAAGLNMVVIDLGEGVRYESHPELAVKGSWTPARLKKQLGKIRDLGLEPIPKLNFSATHDAWLGPYSRCLSTDTYYSVCRDLIAEVIQLFDQPRFFHLGMDEETAEHQRNFEYVVVRQYDLWWKDFNFYVEQVEKGGARPWIWSDYVWRHPDVFFKKMPKSVVQSNWYYGTTFDVNDKRRYVKAYIELGEHGYDQIPTGSNWSSPDNFGLTVEFCKKHIAPERLLGFLQAPWRPTVAVYRQKHLDAIEQVKTAKGKFTARGS